MPRSFGSLFPQLCSFDNLYQAFLAARRGKRDRPEVREFDYRLEGNLLGLQQELQSGRWRPGPYRNFYVQEYKKRLITAAPFRDRVVHHALVRVLEPCFEPAFISDSYACRKGKGQHKAIDRFQRWLKGSRHVLRADIAKFYPSVDHDVLKSLICRRVRDRRALSLTELVLASGEGILEPEYELQRFPGDNLFSPLERARGLPIGNLTSQFFGNVYLDQLDHFVKETLGCRRYLRYMDDFALFSDSGRELADWRVRIGECLGGLRLRMQRRATRVWRTSDGIEFLGFRVFPHYRLVRKATAFHYCHHLRELAGRKVPGGAGQARIRDSLTAWLGHTRHSSAWRLNRQILSRAGLLANVA